MKNFYNEFYDEIYDTFFPKDLLKFPEVISGYYVSNIVGGIMVPTAFYFAGLVWFIPF
jgi:hypothetical protein